MARTMARPKAIARARTSVGQVHTTPSFLLDVESRKETHTYMQTLLIMQRVIFSCFYGFKLKKSGSTDVVQVVDR